MARIPQLWAQAAKARLWIILLIAVAAAVAAGAPIATPVAPLEWWQPVPAGSVRYLTLVSPKPWSDTVTVSTYTNVAVTITHAWTNVTTYYYAPWAARHTATASSAVQWFTVRYALSSGTYIAVNPAITASSGASVTVAVVANATTTDAIASCSVGASALGGRIIACFTVTGTGSLQQLGWVNASYVTSIAVAAYTTANYITVLGAILDVSRRVWVTASGLTVPGSGRQPVYAAVANASGVYMSFTPTPTSMWVSVATLTTAVYYSNVVWTAPVTISPGTRVNVAHRYRLTVPHNVTLAHVYPDTGSASVSITAGDYYIIDDAAAPAWINASTTSGWVKVVEPQWDEHIRLAPIPSTQVFVSFYVQDYGQGYTQLRVYTQDGRIAWRDAISAITQSAVARLQPYGVYVIALWKPGEERALGPLIIDKTSFTLTVLPRVTQPPPPPSASVTYNSSIGAYVVDVSCAAPPCTVTLVKTEKLTGVTLEREAEVRPGTILLPHLYDWYFDGINDYVEVSNTVLPPGTTSLTVLAWAYFNVIPYAVQVIVKQGSGYAYGTYFIYTQYEKYFRAYLRGTDGVIIVMPGVEVYPNTWYFLGLRYDGSEVSTWINAEKKASASFSSPVGIDQPLRLAHPYGLGGAFLNGKIGGVFIYNRALTASEIADLYQWKTINASGLALFLDPVMWNGTHYLSLVNNIAARPYNGAARVPANQTWIWVVYTTGAGVRLMYMRDAVVRFWSLDGGTVRMFLVDRDDVVVDVPPGRYRVEVRFNALSWQREVASFTCSAQQCRFTWQTSDPELTVTVVDSAGSVYRVVTGLPVPVPRAGEWEVALIRFFFSGLAANLGVDPMVLFLAFTAVGVFLTLSAAGYIDAACFATAALLVFLQARYGVNVYAAAVNVMLIAGGLYALTKRVR
ncbi:MAG: LamG domain-containing protein [Thermofilum sp.]